MTLVPNEWRRRAPPLRAPATVDVALDPGLTDRAFARAAGSLPIDGNAVRLLQDAAENYPAWLAAIRGAEHSILFENYIVDDDDRRARVRRSARREGARGGRRQGRLRLAGAPVARAHLWPLLTAAGAHVLAFNRPRLDSPLGWVSRDHRKTLTVDGQIAFVSGLCVSAKWLGDPARQMEPWRDTGIEIRGPAVAEITHAFATVWHACGGDPLPTGSGRCEGMLGPRSETCACGSLPDPPTRPARIASISSSRRSPGTRLWISDAYFVGTSAYVQALAAAARDGVDVRLLVPGASDIPALSPISRAGYRPLLDAGVRVFEWNGTMLHAKTAVADDLWARIGSTNLNIASWMGNYELDVAIEDRGFGAIMAAQYEKDLARSTEIVLTRRNRVGPTEGSAGPGGTSRTLRERRARGRRRGQHGQCVGGGAHESPHAGRRRIGIARQGERVSRSDSRSSPHSGRASWRGRLRCSAPGSASRGSSRRTRCAGNAESTNPLIPSAERGTGAKWRRRGLA